LPALDRWFACRKQGAFSFIGLNLLPPIIAGFIAVLVGFTSSVALVFGAAKAAGASPDQIGSWIGALSLAMGGLTLALSLHYKKPVMIAWSTPGAALLITALNGVPMEQAVGAFMFCGLLIAIAGYSGLFERVMDRLPLALASAILAGVLAKFALDAVRAGQTQLNLVLAMFVTYIIAKRFTARYAVPLVLVVGVMVAWFLGLMQFESFRWSFTQPVWVTPDWSWSTMLSIGVPLFIVTMASQNLPGVATMRASGYDTPVSPVIGSTGIATIALAPFGCYAVNLAAITAAICMTPDAHPDKNKRYWAAVSCGVFYLIIAVIGGSVAALLAAFPQELIFAIAGIALLGTIGNGLAVAMKEEGSREAALVTFLITLSGVTFAGIGSAFWGVIVGGVVYWAFRR
jgi:benzoate membrane transport protein